jgi:CYTH domain-containing protein
MAYEIERKFVLDEAPRELASAPSQPVEQGYLAVGDDEVRVRRIGDRTVLTVKRGSGLKRTEAEAEISADAFAALWPLTEGRRVQKRRYTVDDVIEVDVYEGALAGLIVAEVEFDSEDASAAFEPPEWMGREVTGDGRYSNQRLAIEGRP